MECFIHKQRAGEKISTARKLKSRGVFGLPTAWFVGLNSQDIQRAPGSPLLKK
jgi:hypothetical protein